MLKREELEELIEYNKNLLTLCKSENNKNKVKKFIAELYEELINNYIIN